LTAAEACERNETTWSATVAVEPEETDVILIAEDEIAVRKVATRILERAGYTTIAVENGEEAVLQFRQNADRIALVLLDVVMPKLSGRDALEEIRRTHPEVPAIFCTGYDPNSSQIESATRAGVPIVSKPFDKDDLLDAVESAVHKPCPRRRGATKPSQAAPSQAAPPQAAPSQSALSQVDGAPADRSPTAGAVAAAAAAAREAEVCDCLDVEMLLDQCMGQRAFAEEIFNDFESGLATRIGELKYAVRTEALEEAATIAHSLKGAAGIIGAIRLQRVASELEAASQRGDPEAIVSLLNELVSEVFRFNNAGPSVRRKLRGKAVSQSGPADPIEI